MKEYSYFQAIYLSFYSRNLYRDVVKNWNAGVILYLLFVLAICWAIMMMPIQKSINAIYKQFSTVYVTQLPEMIFENGQVKTPLNHPYLIINPSTKETVAIVDTSGAYPNLENTSATFLLTKTEFYSRDNNDAVKITKIPLGWTYKANPKDMNVSISHYVSWTWLMLFPVLILFSLFYRLVQSVIYGVFGKIFAAIAGVNLTYANILKLTMVALTPVIFISMILDWYSLHFPYAWLFYFVLAMAYLIFGIYANKE